MKKIYSYHIYLWIISLSVLFSMFVGALYLSVYFIFSFLGELFVYGRILSTKNIILAVISIAVLGPMVRDFFLLQVVNIHIDNDIISIEDDHAKNKYKKIQYQTKVKIEEIDSIDIIWWYDSKMLIQPDKGVEKLMNIYPFLSFRVRGGMMKNFCIAYFSKRTVRRLINDVKVLMIKYGNFTPVPSTEELMAKLKRSKDKEKTKNNRNV